MLRLFIGSLIILSALSTNSQSQANDAVNSANASDTLVVLWTSGDPEVAEKVCLMYTHAAAKYEWFKEVILIVWGPSANLLANSQELQAKIKSMKDDGVYLQACVVCADSYGVSEKLREIGIEVIGMGKPLTGYLKKGYRQLTF